MDIVALPGVDVVHDVLAFPWPFEDDTFDHILMSHVLEHVPHYIGHKSSKDGFILIMEEMHRILKPGGRLEVLCPHPDSPDVWADPTHTRIVHPKNFAYFSDDSRYNFYTQVRFKILASEITQRIPRWTFLRLGASRLPLAQHVGLRVPFLKKLLLPIPFEQRVVVEKIA